MGPRSNLLSKKNGRKSHDTVPGTKGRKEAMAVIVNSNNMVLGNKVVVVPGLWI